MYAHMFVNANHVNKSEMTPHSRHSETWNAKTQTPLVKGQQVKVKAVDGLVLEVEPVIDNTEESGT